MGFQIIKQPDDQYTIFDGSSDTIVALDATRQDVIDYFVERAIASATEDTQKWMGEVDGKTKRNLMTYEKVLKTHLENQSNCEDEAWNREVAKRFHACNVNNTLDTTTMHIVVMTK